MFDHNHEMMSEPITQFSSQQVTYRRREIRLKKIFVAIFLLIIVFHTFCTCYKTIAPERPDWIIIYFAVLYATELIYLSVLFG